MSNNAQRTKAQDNHEKTIIIRNLMQTPFAQRDEQWRDTFLAAIDGASLTIADQQIVIGGDGFPYLQLQTVATDEPIEPFVINQELPTILQQGLGLVINGRDDRPDWVFSYGDIVNLELNDEFYTNETIFSLDRGDELVEADEKVLIGQPSDAILPKYLRTHLREFLYHFGLRTPKLMLIARDYEDEEKVTQDLVFNFTPEDFADREGFDEVMRTIAWYLPRHYSFFTIDERAIENGFELI